MALTAIRFSVTGAAALLMLAGVMGGMIISSALVGMVDNLPLFCALFSIPCVAIGTVIFACSVKETNGTKLNKIE